MPSAKSILSSHWWVRIDGELEDLRPKVKEFAQRLDVIRLISAHHKGKTKENPHIHFAVEMSKEVQKQSFALTIKSVFTISSSRNYAIDAWDGKHMEGAPTYLFHEPNVPLLVHKGWNQTETTELQRIGEQIAIAVTDSKQKAGTKLADKAYEHFLNDDSHTRHSILRYMLTEIKEQRSYYPGSFKLKAMVEEVIIRLCPADQFSSLVSQFERNLFRFD